MDVVGAIQNIICSRCPIRKECGAQKGTKHLESLIMCIYHGPVDYCDEEFFMEIPILGDPRFFRQPEES